MKADKGVLGGQGAPRPLSPVPSTWTNFYGPTQYDFDRTHLPTKLRRKVTALVQHVPPRERMYARWLPWKGDVIVFEVKPDQIRGDGRGYSPSTVLNVPNLYVGRPLQLPLHDGVGFDLDEQVVADEFAHLDHRRRRLDVAEDLAVRAAHEIGLRHVDDEHPRPDDIGKRAA